MDPAIECVPGLQVIFFKDFLALSQYTVSRGDEGAHDYFRIPLKSCPLLSMRALYSLLLFYNLRMTVR